MADYIIEVAAYLLTVYHDAELGEDSIAPAVECGTVERIGVAEFRAAFPFV